MQLQETQAAFIAVIFKSPQQPPSTAQQATQTAANLVRNHGELTAEQRLSIYRGSVHGILTQALEATYPVCRALVGDTFFSKMCSVFIDQSPPTSPYFHEYGDNLADFLQQFPPAQRLPYLSDMARLEWLRHSAWQQKNQTASDFTQLATLSAEEQLACRFQLPQSAQRLSSAYAIHALWQAHQTPNADENSRDKPATATADFSQLTIDEPCHALVWRANRGIQQQPLTAHQADFLQAVQQQKTLAELAAQFTEQLPHLLSESIQAGWIHAFQRHPLP
ncbi:MAG: HvfC/BufC N-terminal domain-containing protein [bacterium]